MEDLTYTPQQAIKNAKPYKDFFIGTMSLRGDSRYVTYIFDKNMKELYSFIGSERDAKEYIDDGFTGIE